MPVGSSGGNCRSLSGVGERLGRSNSLQTESSEEIGIGGLAEFLERDNMRQIIWGFIALSVIAAMSDAASARDRQSRRQPQSVQQNDRPGLFGGLIEMERRKNAWLRQSFGR